MQELLDEYIRHLDVERSLSLYTIRNYTSDILDFFNFLQLEEIDSLESVDHAVIRNYLGQLLEKGTVRASISRKMSALRSFFQYLYREKLISNEPMSQISGPKTERRLPSYLTTEEIISLLSAPDQSTPFGLRDQAVLELLYASGLRVSEIVSLNIHDVDFDNSQLRVWGKGAKERMVMMGMPAVASISEYLQYGRSELQSEQSSEALFLNRYGNRIAKRRIQYLLQKYAKCAGIKRRVHPHMLRHTFATHMLDGGADLRVVQELLGHSDLSSTQVYTHVTRSHMRRKYLEAHPRSSETKKVKKPEAGEITSDQE